MDLMTLLVAKANSGSGGGGGSSAGGDSGISIDRTLTKSGYAADAKIVGNRLTVLSNNISDANAATEAAKAEISTAASNAETALNNKVTSASTTIDNKVSSANSTIDSKVSAAETAIEDKVSAAEAAINSATGGIKDNRMVRTTTSSTNVTIPANTKIYISGTPTSVTVSLGTPVSGYVTEYVLAFKCGSTAAELGLPSNVTLHGDYPKANAYYELSINEDNIAYGIATEVDQ